MMDPELWDLYEETNTGETYEEWFESGFDRAVGESELFDMATEDGIDEEHALSMIEMGASTLAEMWTDGDSELYEPC